MDDTINAGQAEVATTPASFTTHDRDANHDSAGLIIAIAASVAGVIAFAAIYWNAIPTGWLMTWAVGGVSVTLAGGIWLQKRLADGTAADHRLHRAILCYAITTAMVWALMPTSSAFIGGEGAKWPLLAIPLYVVGGWLWVFPLFPAAMLVVCGGVIGAAAVRLYMLGGADAYLAVAGFIMIAAIVIRFSLRNLNVLMPESTARSVLEGELETRLAWFERAEAVADVGQWYWTVGSEDVRWSGAMYRLAGVDPDTFEPTFDSVIALYDKADRERIQTIYRDAIKSREPFEFETTIERAGNRDRYILVQGRCETDGDTLVAVFGFLQDITDRKLAEQALRRSEAFYRAIVEVQSELIFRCLFDGALTFVNTAFCRFFAVTREDAIGASLFEDDDLGAPIVTRETADIMIKAYESLTPEKPRMTDEMKITGEDGEARWLLCTHQALFDGRDFLIEYQTVALDITDRKRADSKIEYLAHHDALTGLPNRALFQDRLELAVAHAKRSDGRAAVLLLDLDNFKHVNDALGHATGDVLLRGVAERLKDCVREVDTVARLGGDEFVIIQAGIESGEQAVILAERIRSKIARPFEIDGHEIHTGTSIGITVYPDDSRDLKQVLKNADLALYRAKARERGTYEFYSTELGFNAQKRLDIAAGLRRALARSEELSLVFQPKFSLVTGHAIGVEALLRWERPDHDSISPAEFIPVAEATGLILPIGEWVLQRACEYLRDWRDAGVPLVPLSVNLSAAQFRDHGLVTKVRKCIADYGIDPAMLEIEITETALMHDADIATTTLRELVGVGIAVSIDDFGTGYSSLNYLKKFPVGKLKIDRSFVSDIGRSDEDAAIAQAITQLGHSLGLSVLAEGVETETQLEVLRAMGCDEVQGFLMSRPLRAEHYARSMIDIWADTSGEDLVAGEQETMATEA